MLIKRVHYIVRSSAFHPQYPHCATECNLSFHINTTQLSVVQFHARHYTTEYNVYFVSTLCIVSLEIMCTLLFRNFQANSDK